MRNTETTIKYGNLFGHTAADSSEIISPQMYLEHYNLITDKEFFVGLKMFAGENHGTHEDPVHVYFFVTELNGHNDIQSLLSECNGNIEVREVKVDMTIAEFIALFKRLEISLSQGGESKSINETNLICTNSDLF